MASQYDEDYNREALARRKKKGPPFMYLLPVVYAPVLPLIRIGLRRNPVLRDRLFYGVLAGAFAHGMYVMYPFSFFNLFLLCYAGSLAVLNHFSQFEFMEFPRISEEAESLIA
ncbi:hypothetical protein Tsubulata_025543 [Turnera subulata]|uniref:Uncharacterized protein n=1 Tax=Turnera subulata TaxID=218843 RepID=A0A9Q0F8K1_9ROSI|nr:hypothetical protein Tsubulata_025543 [Turnera subulata]